MNEVAFLIADLVRAGVDPELIGRVAATIAKAGEAEPDKSVSSAALRMRKYRERRAQNGMNANNPEYLSHSAAVKTRDGYACVYCSEVDDLVIDHMVPICQGGTDHIDNLATACRACNASKAGKTVGQWGRDISNTPAGDALLRYVAHVAPSVALTPSPLVPPLSPAPLSPPIIPPSSKTSRATELPNDWQPDAKTWALADELGFTAQQTWDQLDRMRDWARNAGGGKGRKSDWNAAFRNWIKRAADERRSKPQAFVQRNNNADSFAILDAVFDEAIRRADGSGEEGGEEDSFEFPGLRKSAA